MVCIVRIDEIPSLRLAFAEAKEGLSHLFVNFLETVIHKPLDDACLPDGTISQQN
jgi:hypothetical protein